MFYKSIKDLNDYQIVRILGEGTYGKTYLIEQKKSTKLYVAKEYKQGLISIEDQQSFYKEIDFRAKEKYPELLTLEGLSFKNFDGEDYPVLITNYMENGSLENNFNKLSSQQKYILMLSLANCLDYLKSKSVMHLNLKPTNILLDSSFYPRIADYCGFKIHQLNSNIDNNIGLSLYMAPEVIMDKQYTDKSDVYSFGMIAYEVLSNDRFTDIQKKYDSFDEIPKNIMPNLTLIKNEKLRNIVMKCLSSDPRERPSFEEIIKTLLNNDNIKKEMGIEFYNLEKYYSFQCLGRANNGDPVAMNMLACLQEQGTKALVDPSKTEILYQRAIDLGNGSAMFNYAGMKIFGRRIPKDIEGGIKLLEMAIKMNNHNAMANYASFLYIGEFIPQDRDKAMSFFNLAILNNNTNAINNLAVIYKCGYGVPANINKAIELYMKGVELNNPSSMRGLASIYRHYKEPIKNVNEAIRLLKLAVDLDDDEARCDLGDMYLSGECGRIDREEARSLYEKALKNGYQPAEIKLYNMEKGTPININKESDDFVQIAIVEFYDGLPITKPKRYHFKYVNTKT